MVDMTKGFFQRHYRDAMKTALQPYGFKRKGSLFFRERDGLLHLLSLDRSPFDGAFPLDVAVQPLVFPFETFNLSLGGRLDRCASHIPARWDVPSTEAELVQSLKRFAEAVVEVGVPWLDRFQSVKDIVEIDRAASWGIWPPPGGGPVHRGVKVGLCALDAGLYDRGRELLERAYAEVYARIGEEAPEWDRERRRMLEGLLRLLDEGNTEQIRRQLEEYKQYTRRSLGI